MNTFEKVLILKEERETIRHKVMEHNKNVEAIESEIKERILNDTAANDNKIIELKEKLQDGSKTQTIRKMYSAEIEKLEKNVFMPTEFEKETLLNELSDYKQAISDFRKVHSELTTMLRNAHTELNTIAEQYRMQHQPSDYQEFADKAEKRINKFLNEFQESSI